MTATLTSPGTALAELVHAVTRIWRDEHRRAALITELQSAALVPALFVPGIEHRGAAAIVATGMPTVEYRRRTLHRRIDEHLILDVEAGTGVRVMACWDDRAHRVRMHVAEVGASRLWERSVACFTAWEMTGRPVPTTDGSAS
ncbi:hypothetical protein [Amycolatopsis sp. H20-H5]|uniref:hypothetical protein n=1 Tax=Amycolatopsis sp. H20-H5 TaxID=3046309 RepID=UPI002DBDB9FE|nr:hypothetical protein [Amycolatopsis sp. H20-H5]MEC3974285.1 hypothetical protein [Amycolatopsis sp. H20-H5]